MINSSRNVRTKTDLFQILLTAATVYLGNLIVTVLRNLTQSNH